MTRRRPATTRRSPRRPIQPLIDIDYWPVDDDGLDRKRLESLIAVMKKTGGIKADKEPVKYDRLVDQSVWRDAKAMVDAKAKAALLPHPGAYARRSGRRFTDQDMRRNKSQPR